MSPEQPSTWQIDRKPDSILIDLVLRKLDRVLEDLVRLQCEIAVIDAAVQKLLSLETGRAVDLAIELGQQTSTPTKGTTTMPNKKASGPAIKCPCLSAKGGPKKAVMPAITITSPPASVTLQPLDASGNPVTLQPADSVTGTLTSDNPGLTISAGADTTHWVATIPPNTAQGTVANLAATLNGTIAGAPANLTASVAVTLDIPPSPVAVDLAIVFGS